MKEGAFRSPSEDKCRIFSGADKLDRRRLGSFLACGLCRFIRYDEAVYVWAFLSHPDVCIICVCLKSCDSEPGVTFNLSWRCKL